MFYDFILKIPLFLFKMGHFPVSFCLFSVFSKINTSKKCEKWFIYLVCGTGIRTHNLRVSSFNHRPKDSLFVCLTLPPFYISFLKLLAGKISNLSPKLFQRKIMQRWFWVLWLVEKFSAANQNSQNQCNIISRGKFSL